MEKFTLSGEPVLEPNYENGGNASPARLQKKLRNKIQINKEEKHKVVWKDPYRSFGNK